MALLTEAEQEWSKWEESELSILEDDAKHVFYGREVREVMKMAFIAGFDEGIQSQLRVI